MFENISLIEGLKLFAPLIIIQYGLAIYCVINILRKGVQNLNKTVWIIIVLVVNTVGPISYLLFGRKRWDY